MKRRFLTIFVSVALMMPVWNQAAASPVSQVTFSSENDDEDEAADDDGATVTSDDNDASVRQNAVIDFGEISDDDIDIPVPTFIHRDRNHIEFNGADWTALRKAFANAEIKPVSIVHIGDSHIQADIGTGTTRELLQYDFGNAGRGLVTPLKMSGTNQPSDYSFSSSDNWQPVKLMSRRWERPMGFTGTSVHPMMQSSSVTIGTTESDDYNPFKSITLFHGGKMQIEKVVNQYGSQLHYRAIPSRDYTHIILASAETKVTVYFKSHGDLTLYGASLSGDKPGLFYHAIGNNGATYATYNKIGTVGVGISALQPDLVIISLGTNEAFGNPDASTFYNTIDRLVSNIRYSNPSAQILLVTPMECQKSVTKTVSKKVASGSRRSKGGKKRRRSGGTRTVTSTVKTYQRNANIPTMRNEILRYGRENGVAVLDFYEVAGGQGASDSWINNNLFAKDRIHHSYKGYHLTGRLMYDALIDALKQENKQ